MNSTHQTVNILKFCRFYYHLQVFKQSNLINYQHNDSGSNRERITVEIHVFHYNSGGKKCSTLVLQLPVAEMGISWGSAIVQWLVTGDYDQSNDRSALAEMNRISVSRYSWNSYSGSLLLQVVWCVAVCPCLFKCCMRMRCGLQNYLGCHWKYCSLLPVTFFTVSNHEF